MANEQGIEQVTIASLAKVLGIRSPSLYNPFPSLRALGKQIALQALDKLKNELTRSVIVKTQVEAILLPSLMTVIF